MSVLFLRTLRWLPVVLLLFSAVPANAQPLLHAVAGPTSYGFESTDSSFQDIPGLRTFFVAKDPGAASVCVSFEAGSEFSDGALLRAVIDGTPASPEEIELSGGIHGASSFIFAATVTAGLHEAKIQWMIPSGGAAQIAKRTLWISTAPTLINTFAAPSGSSLSFETTDTNSERAIPDLSGSFSMPGEGDAIVTITALAAGTYVGVFPDIDGIYSSPISIDSFAVSEDLQLNGFTFITPDLTAGEHEFYMTAYLSPDSQALIVDRTVTLASSIPTDLEAGQGGVVGVTRKDYVSTSSDSFVDIPGMTASIVTPENSSMVIGFQAEASAQDTSPMYVQALIDDQVATPGAVAYEYRSESGTRSFYFVAKNLRAGTHHVKIQWGSLDGASVSLVYRTMTIIALPTQNHTGNCWWFTENEPGTGLSVEVRADRLFLAWYTYSQTNGLPEWHVAGGAMTDSFTFTGSLYRYTGWPLGTAYVPPTSMPIGSVTLTFDQTDADSATLSWNANDSIGSKDFQKFMPTYETGEQDSRDINGWWWDPAYNGMGVYMEARGQSIFMAWYQYREDGSPRWWSIGGSFSPGSPSFIGTLEERKDGQWIGGDYHEPGQPQDRGQVAFVFNADGTATMTWSERVYNLERFRF